MCVVSSQVNKNVLLKGKLGSDAVSVLAACKTWFNPSVALAAAAEYGFRSKKAKYGLTIQVCGDKGGGGEQALVVWGWERSWVLNLGV